MTKAKKLKNNSVKEPAPKKKCIKSRIHGIPREDCYNWMREIKSQKVKKHISDENNYALQNLRNSKKTKNILYKEMRSRVSENDISIAIKHGEYYYYSKMEKNKQYEIYCRKKGKNGKEIIILDTNNLAKGQIHFSLGSLLVSPSSNLLAYSTDITGNEFYTLYIKDLKTNKILEIIKKSIGSIAWTQDEKSILYTKEKHPFPASEVWMHNLGENTKADTLIYKEVDSSWAVQIYKSASQEYIFINSGNFEETEIRVLPGTNPSTKNMVLVAPRKKNVDYSIEHHDKYFYITTNEKAVNYKIMRTFCKTPNKKYWKQWMAHSLKRSIEELESYKDYLVLTIREKGSSEIYVQYGKNMEKIKLPEKEHSVSIYGRPEFNSKEFYISYSSFLTPPTTYSYIPSKKKLTSKKVKKVTGYKKSLYISKRIWINNGSVRIPVELMYKKTTNLNGVAPLLLTAYGSYGISMDPFFSLDKLSLVDRGWIIALAHPRGGGEMGESWHKKAYLLTKQNTADDFIAVTKKLGKTITTPEKLAISGGSAGGMLMGMVLNEAPKCCGAALVYVPAADVVTSMLDSTMPGTKIHYSEVGDPKIKSHYKYMMSYSPYENIKTQKYPKILVRASYYDIRTPFWEAAKWVAKLREKKTDSNNILLLTEMHAGHSGKSGRYERLKNRSTDFAFLLDAFKSNK